MVFTNTTWERGRKKAFQKYKPLRCWTVSFGFSIEIWFPYEESVVFEILVLSAVFSVEGEKGNDRFCAGLGRIGIFLDDCWLLSLWDKTGVPWISNPWDGGSACEVGVEEDSLGIWTEQMTFPAGTE